MLQPNLPQLGLGTWQNTNPEQCVKSVRTAVNAGYRHVDTAHYYGNEEYVGEGIATADVNREDVFVATKVHAEKTGLNYDGVIKGAELSCERLGVDYLDILYVHWPVVNYDAEETMAAFDDLYESDTINHIGLSNFTPDLLNEARMQLDAPLFVHQIEMHPLCPQEDLVAYAQEHDHYLVAYSPLAQGRVFDLPQIQAVAEKHSVSEAQVSLAWLLSKDNVVAIPKATSEAHIRDNLSALNLKLDDEDLERIESIERKERFVERDDAPWLV